MKIRRNTKELVSLIDEWLKVYLPDTKMRSMSTIDTYESALSLYLDFLEKHKGITCTTFSEECFGKEWIEEWMSFMAKYNGNSLRTCDLRLSCIRSLLKYLSSRNAIYLKLYLDACGIHKLSRGRGRPVDGISKKAMKALFAAMNGEGNTELRDRTLFTCMYDTGARVGEILGIRIRDLKLDCETPYVVITGKGSKVRTLLLSKETLTLMKRYIKDQHGTHPNPDSFLFYSRVRGRLVALDSDSVNVRMKIYARKAHEICPEIPVSFHTHKIRHSSCTHWFQDNVNLALISKYLGHESIETTRIYLGISKEELITALQKRDKENVVAKGRYDGVKGGLRSLIKPRNAVEYNTE